MKPETIIGHIRTSLTERNISGSLDIVALPDEKLISLIFKNVRGKARNQSHGLSLTTTGYDIMRDCFECYDIDLDKIPTSRDIISLDKIMKTPYRVTNSQISVFDQSVASMIRLAGNNINKALEILSD